MLNSCLNLKVKIQGQNAEMLLSACEQFLGKSDQEIQHIALVTLEGHQRAIMGSMTVEEIYKDRKMFSKKVTSTSFILKHLTGYRLMSISQNCFVTSW